MNCKTLFHGPLSLKKLESSSEFVRKAICAALWDEADRLALSSADQLELFSAWKNPFLLYKLLNRKRIFSINVIEQYASSRFSSEDCNVIVRFSQDVYCKTYVTKYL